MPHVAVSVAFLFAAFAAMVPAPAPAGPIRGGAAHAPIAPGVDAQRLKSLHVFGVGTDGAGPFYGGLVADANGALFGTTYVGGQFGAGTIYRLTPKASGGFAYKEIYSFGTASADGAAPYAGVTFDKSGALYGTTESGGMFGGGTVYKLTPAKSGYSESVLVSLPDGAFSYGGVAVDGNGVVYAQTYSGGRPGYGSVFTLTPSGSSYTMTQLYAFKGGTKDGVYPIGALSIDGNGTIYGTTEYGGAAGDGIVFALVKNGGSYGERVLYQFQGGADGASPQCGLLFDAKGNIFGTTAAGGTPSYGTVFELTPSGGGAYSESVLYTFAGGGDGGNPVAGLIANSAGVLFGTTYAGGAYGVGNVYKLIPTKTGYTFRVVYPFLGGASGANSYAPVIEDANGVLYGTTNAGGTPNQGTVFRLKP